MDTIRKIRKEVTTIANRLNKTIKNLSASFKRAWSIVKGKRLICKLSGVTFGNRQLALRKLEEHKRNSSDIKVNVKREQSNKFDENALIVEVSVNNSRAYQLGYLPKDIAKYLSPVIASVGELNASFIEVVGGYTDKPTRGCKIAIDLF